MTGYSSPTPGTPQQPAGWQPAPYGSPTYQGRGQSPSAHGHPGMHPSIPYAFGQLPSNVNPHDPKSQHPIPGSYNRNHNFNPKTQSFVPGSNDMVPGVPVPQPPPFASPASHHGSPQMGPPAHVVPGPYPGYPPPGAPPYGGHGMMRQASNTSVPGYPQHMVPPPPPGPYGHPPQPQMQPQMQMHGQPPRMPNRPPHQGPPGAPGFSHLPTYGNPATLPQKPATGF